MTQEDRDSVIRQCIAALPVRRYDMQWQRAAGYDDCYDLSVQALTALLSETDHSEASEPLQSARSDVAPVDHGPGADAHGETGAPKTYEDGIRACIEALPDRIATYVTLDGIPVALEGISNAASRKALEALLPTPPDPAKALVDSYQQKLGCYLTDGERATLNGFAEMLITEGRIG
jgi:hypothetical protein